MIGVTLPTIFSAHPRDRSHNNRKDNTCRSAPTLFLLVAGLLLGAATNGFGQQFTGGIRGTVSDANGVMPGVSVTVTNEATAVPRETVTNAVGEYNFSALAPATYSIRASLPGYKTYDRRASVSRRSSSSRST